MGFKINQYNCCVANKIINGKKCTITFHVDDLKISHCKENIIKNIIDVLNQKYRQEVVNGKKLLIVAHYFKIYDYLGMTIDYSMQKKVKFTMYNYI